MTQYLSQYKNKAQAKRETSLSYLGGINTSSKIAKGLKYDEMTYILYLAPADRSGYEQQPAYMRAAITGLTSMKMLSIRPVLRRRSYSLRIVLSSWAG
jgi:hypothetical protein